MRVLHILDSPNRGGGERLVVDVCAYAATHDLEMWLAVLHGGDLEEEIKSRINKYLRFDRRLPVDPFVVLRLRRFIRAHEIDIVHVHQPVEAVHALLATIGGPAKIVMTHHGIVFDIKNRVLVKIIPKLVDSNVTVSHSFSEQLRQKQKIANAHYFKILYNGIDPARFSTPKTSRLRGDLSISSKELLMGMVGNFVPGKDQLTICRALPSVFTKFPHAQFVFIGSARSDSAGMLTQCKSFCADNGILNKVHFAGVRDDIPGDLHALDLFVFSSIGDSFGIAVVEAMMAGLPAVVSDLPPLLEITDNGRYARTFEIGNAQSLAAALIELLASPEERKRRAAEGKRWACEQFSLDRHVNQLQKLYEEVISS